MNNGSHDPQEAAELGPRSVAIIERLPGSVPELERCGHGPEDFFFWIATCPACCFATIATGQPRT